MKFRIIENNQVLNVYFDSFGDANKEAYNLLKQMPENNYIVILECKKHQRQPESQLIGWGTVKGD